MRRLLGKLSVQAPIGVFAGVALGVYLNELYEGEDPPSNVRPLSVSRAPA